MPGTHLAELFPGWRTPRPITDLAHPARERVPGTHLAELSPDGWAPRLATCLAHPTLGGPPREERPCQRSRARRRWRPCSHLQTGSGDGQNCPKQPLRAWPRLSPPARSHRGAIATLGRVAHPLSPKAAHLPPLTEPSRLLLSAAMRQRIDILLHSRIGFVRHTGSRD